MVVHMKKALMIIFTDEGSYKKEDLRVFNTKQMLNQSDMNKTPSKIK